MNILIIIAHLLIGKVSAQLILYHWGSWSFPFALTKWVIKHLILKALIKSKRERSKRKKRKMKSCSLAWRFWERTVAWMDSGKLTATLHWNRHFLSTQPSGQAVDGGVCLPLTVQLTSNLDIRKDYYYYISLGSEIWYSSFTTHKIKVFSHSLKILSLTKRSTPSCINVVNML